MAVARSSLTSYLAVGAHGARERVLVDAVQTASDVVVLDFAERHRLLPDRKQTGLERRELQTNTRLSGNIGKGLALNLMIL